MSVYTQDMAFIQQSALFFGNLPENGKNCNIYSLVFRKK